MYEDFFGLRESPFSLSPDPRYLWLSETHQEALSALYYGITSRAGFILLTGEVGAGKTTLLRACLDHLPADTVTAMVFNTAEIAPTDLLALMMADLGVEARGPSKAEKLIAIQEYLLRNLDRRTNVVVVIDEAHNLSEETLEEVRLLSNFETNNAKLLQLVLTGQPELLDKLARPRLRQLRQRIVVEHSLDYLTSDEIGMYLRHRISCAGGKFEQIFQPGVEEAFFDGSRGCPRLVSLLAHKSLLTAFTRQMRPVTIEVVQEKSRQLPPLLMPREPVVKLPVSGDRG